MNRRIFLVLVISAMLLVSMCSTAAAMWVDSHPWWVSLSLLAALSWSLTAILGSALLVVLLLRTYDRLPP